SPNIPRVDLVEVHPQARSSGIPQIAHEIRHGIVPPLPAFAGLCPGVSFIDAGDGHVMDHILGVLSEWCGCDDTRILSMTKRGASGIRNINATLHSMACTAKPKLEGWGVCRGRSHHLSGERLPEGTLERLVGQNREHFEFERQTIPT